MRIAHVTNEPFGLDMANGIQHVVYWLARAQAQIGHSVAVFSRDDHAIHVMQNGSAPTRLESAAVARLSQTRSLRQTVLSRYFEPTLAEHVLGWQPDIVHFHSVHIPQNVALASCLHRIGIPYCVTVHGALFAPALRRRQLKKTIFKLCFERQYLNEARFIHALSPKETKVIRLYGVHRPSVVVPNGLPPDATTPAQRPDVLYEEFPGLRDLQVFMFIGRLDPWQKGLDLLIEAFAQARLANAALVLVGPDVFGSRDRLAKIAERLGIASRVVFTGPALGEKRANLLAAAHLFVHPSRWEGLSLSVLAAAAAEKLCVITRDADPSGELEAANAAVLVDATVESIAAGLTRAAGFTDDELRRIGRRARGVTEAQFDWQVVAGRLVDAYQRAS